eukprot:PLAT1635.2.p2 GENE.PLAT1635.2~~PLAT1635.2.p2  ORF type:complete len:133 (+),score=13.81 PLAT1635.2:71-469(+)
MAALTRLSLYYRPACAVSNGARQLLASLLASEAEAAASLDVREVNVAARGNEHIAAKVGDDVPLLVMDGELLDSGRMSEALIRSAIRLRRIPTESDRLPHEGGDPDVMTGPGGLTFTQIASALKRKEELERS